MRSSKSRSRNKSNRNRSVGNVVNRVFDSSGPEGKVRGTPQQIIDKYNQLARDAQLANDRVAAENFQQHAEHYLRMLAEAMREQQERQAQQQNQQNQHRRQEDQNRNENDQDTRNNAPASDTQKQDKLEADVIEMTEQGSESGLVETPEDRPKRQRRPRRKPEEGDAPQKVEAASDPQPAPPDAAE